MDAVFVTEYENNIKASDSHENIQEEEVNSNAAEKKEAFVFPEVSEQEEARLNAAESSIENTCQSFAEALDSVSIGLTKELLDIYETLEGILGVRDEKLESEKNIGKAGVEKTVLWSIAYKLLYEKHKDIFPEKLKDILGEMLRDLSEYGEVKIKHKSLKDMLRSCSSIASVQSAINIDGGRTFIPGNLGCHSPY